MATAIQIPPRPDLEYPDRDGKPMSDNTAQFKWIVIIKDGLEAVFDDDPNVFVAGDLLWYPVEGDNSIRNAPDVLVAFGRPKGRRGSYKQWEEGGIAPQVVFEILSPGNRAGEMERKIRFYERYGVEEYYIYDPDYGDLVGWRRVGEGLEEIPEMAGFVSPRLGIRFEPGEGPDNLTIIGPDGRPFVTHADAIEQRDAAEQQRDAAEQQRDAADQRAERYAAKLRELGIEPD
jgi:Uma2 family endonuclease